MVVAREVHQELRVIDRIKDMVRLSAGINKQGLLRDKACDAALDTLGRFSQRLRGIPKSRIRVVGTSTLRRARNGQAFRERAETVLGVPIDVISGREEARLIYLGVAHNHPDDGQRLVIDIGGGSTELVIGQQMRVIETESIEMGCVNMTQTFFEDGIVDKKRMRSAELHARVEIEPIEEPYRQHGWQTVVGTSGTIKTIAAVCQAAGWVEQGIDCNALKRLRDELIDAGHCDAFDYPGLSEERRSVFAGGVAVLLAVFKQLDIEWLTVSDSALREGVLYDLLGRLHDADVRERTVVAMSSRHAVDTRYAANVERTAVALFDSYRSQRRDSEDNVYADRRVLSWAARLHEIGFSISHSKYHKHGEYLIRHSDMPGFAEGEKAALAILVRNHRRSFDLQGLSVLPESARKRYVHLSIMLRLAVLLNRGRTGQPPVDLGLRIGKQTVHLTVPDQWLASHPLTVADLTEETIKLQQIDHVLTF